MRATDLTSVDRIREEPFQVRTYETDAGGLVKVAGLCNYLQEAAGSHAAELGISIDDLGRENKTWVLSQLRLNLAKLPKPGDRILIRTWPSGIDRLFALRDFEILDYERQVLVKATSLWLIIDRTTRRPSRLPDFVTRLVRTNTPRVLTANSSLQLPGPNHVTHSAGLMVRKSDLDINGHVNNAHYVEWAMEPVDSGFRGRYRLKELTAQFLAECRYGARIISNLDETEEGDSKVLHHQLEEETGEVPLARLETHWVNL